MADHVDLTNLREMTDGDEDMERMLFDEFYLSSEECISKMEGQCTDGENEEFRSNAHALKGTAINLGAEYLSNLCKKAQEEYTVSAVEKNKMLSDIKEEYTNVKNFLKGIYS